MKKEKKFDCVEMKWQIQEQIRKEHAALRKEDARKLEHKRAAADPILSGFLQKVRRLQPALTGK